MKTYNDLSAYVYQIRNLLERQCNQKYGTTVKLTHNIENSRTLDKNYLDIVFSTTKDIKLLTVRVSRYVDFQKNIDKILMTFDNRFKEEFLKTNSILVL